MTLTAFLAGMFSIFESIPMFRDALYAALDGIIATRVEAAKQARLEAYENLKTATTPEAAASALGAIIRNRPL